MAKRFSREAEALSTYPNGGKGTSPKGVTQTWAEPVDRLRMMSGECSGCNRPEKAILRKLASADAAEAVIEA